MVSNSGNKLQEEPSASTTTILAKLEENTTRILKQICDTKSELSDRIEIIAQKTIALGVDNSKTGEIIRTILRNQKKNNIIIHGIEENEDEKLMQNTKTLFENRLKLVIDDIQFDNIFRLGKRTEGKARPVLVQLTTNRCKQEILREAARLKGTGFSIVQDLCLEDRISLRQLLPHFKKARELGLRAKIKEDHLIVNGDRYSLKELNNPSTLLSRTTFQKITFPSASTSDSREISTSDTTDRIANLVENDPSAKEVHSIQGSIDKDCQPPKNPVNDTTTSQSVKQKNPPSTSKNNSKRPATSPPSSPRNPIKSTRAAVKKK